MQGLEACLTYGLYINRQKGNRPKKCRKKTGKAAARSVHCDKAAARQIGRGSGGGDTPLSGFARAGDGDRIKISEQKAGGGCTKNDNNTSRKEAGKREIEQDGRRRGKIGIDRAE